LRVTGPLAAGKVSGAVYVTQSRFFREIDILPIALPGRPKPEPRSAPSEASFSLGPPLGNWTFDIAIKTRLDDPFQIRSNLAMGKIGVDLKFEGTGAKPALEGIVRIESLTASLPFSKLEIRHGFITFSRDAFLQPKLDLIAESELRDYRITANIYGSATDPQVSLTSQPPLPQGDIISLLATGTTLSELTGKSDVLASRAAILLFQQLYQKIFKKAPPTSNNSMMDRFSVDAGAVDSRTGRQQVSASLKLVDQLYLIGDVDVTGAFAGRVKYLIRFR
jgi:autotransporter translocation and assembly factor TamB